MITKTHIETVRSKMKENRVYINKQINRTEEEAFLQILEGGCLFLQKIYGRESAPYIKHSRSKDFWNWYRLQWFGCEDVFVNLMNKTLKRVPQSTIKNQYDQYLNFFCIDAERIDIAFKNYLKSKR